MKKRWFLFVLFFSFISLGETKSRTLEKYILPSNRKPLWNPIKKEHIPDLLDIHFNCDSSKRLSITFSHPQFSHLPESSSAIIKIRASHYPPEGERESQFIYTAQLSQDKNQLNIHQRRVGEFIKDFETLSAQADRNEKNRLKEYEDRMKYCQNLPKKQQQQCFQSSSGYQDVESSIIVEIQIPNHPSKTIYSFFDPQKVEHLKNLSCHK